MFLELEISMLNSLIYMNECVYTLSIISFQKWISIDFNVNRYTNTSYFFIRYVRTNNNFDYHYDTAFGVIVVAVYEA